MFRNLKHTYQLSIDLRTAGIQQSISSLLKSEVLIEQYQKNPFLIDIHAFCCKACASGAPVGSATLCFRDRNVFHCRSIRKEISHISMSPYDVYRRIEISNSVTNTENWLFVTGLELSLSLPIPPNPRVNESDFWLYATHTTARRNMNSCEFSVFVEGTKKKQPKRQHTATNENVAS